MKILLLGDSFGADWSIKHTGVVGWPNLLAKEYIVDNRCQAGCSEFKIRNQLINHSLADITHCIVVHTSPYRIPVKENPLHKGDRLHHSCDFIYSDVAESNDPQVKCVKEFYEKYFFDDFFLYSYNLTVDDIKQTLDKAAISSLHITFFPSSRQFDINYSELFAKSPGKANHLSDKANQQVFNEVKQWIVHN